MCIHPPIPCLCAGPPELTVNAPASVNTLSDLPAGGEVRGFPTPSVQLFRVESDGSLTAILPATHPRFAISLEQTVLSISVDATQVGDAGSYRVVATNARGTASQDFEIVTIGDYAFSRHMCVWVGGV